MSKKILYFDMDGVLADFGKRAKETPQEYIDAYHCDVDEIPGIFADLDPVPGAIQAFNTLSDHFDCYILTTAPWGNPSALSDKRLWVEKYLGDKVFKRLIISHNKHLNIGDYLVDDRLANGADRFTGEHIHFGTDKFPDWKKVTEYLMNNK